MKALLISGGPTRPGIFLNLLDAIRGGCVRANFAHHTAA